MVTTGLRGPVDRAVRFVSELALVVGAAWAGLQASVLAAVVAPLLVVVVWGAWVAPKAGRRLADPGRLMVEVVLFGLVGAALVVSGSPVAGALLVGVGVGAALTVRRVAPGG